MAINGQVLRIALQDGFDDDLVIVLVNGQEVLRKANVRTDPRFGLAYAFEVPLPDAPVTVEVQLPQRQVSNSTRLNIDGTVYLGVSYVNGVLQFITSAEPFLYR
jgi:hypothetical protein